MNDLIALDSRRLGCIDGGKKVITHFTCQALIRQASDPLTLFPTRPTIPLWSLRVTIP